MKKDYKRKVDRLTAPAPHSSQGIGMSFVPQAQIVVVLPVDKSLRLKEEIINEVRNLGTSIASAHLAIKEVMTVKEATAYFGVFVKHLMELRCQKKIGCSQNGHVFRFDRSHVLSYLESHTLNRR